jgi:hypothetical protein
MTSTGGASDIDPLGYACEFQGMTSLANSRNGYLPKAVALGVTSLETSRRQEEIRYAQKDARFLNGQLSTDVLAPCKRRRRQKLRNVKGRFCTRFPEEPATTGSNRCFSAELANTTIEYMRPCAGDFVTSARKIYRFEPPILAIKVLRTWVDFGAQVMTQRYDLAVLAA